MYMYPPTCTTVTTIATIIIIELLYSVVTIINYASDYSISVFTGKVKDSN